MSKRVGISMACAVGALVAGCHKAPEGQVAAKVNGDEITLQELNTELQSANLPASADKQNAQRLLLQQVIERKLLVGAAKDKGMDKSSDYLSQKRRVDELLLAQAYAKQQLAAVPLPSDAQVTKFMTDHPTAFAQRELLQLDQIRFAPPQNIQQLKALSGDHSMDAVAARLTSLGIKFQRLPATLDTAQAPPQLLAAIAKLPATEPFVIPSANMVTVNVVTGRKPVAADPTQAKAIAVQAWRQQQFGDLIRQQITTLKNSAKITYQNGFGPPTGPAAPGAIPASPAGAPAAPPAGG